MNFIVSSSVLLKQLQSLSGVINTNHTLPILSNFLFEVNKNELVITATDLDTTMSALIAVTSKEKGSVAIPSKILLDTLKTLPPDIPLAFTIDASFGIDISAGEGKYRVAGQNANEFPKRPVVEGGSSLEMKSDILESAISKTLFATGNDELRPVMSGVFCQLSPESIMFVATDAHKLVRYTRTDVKSGAAKSFIIPKKPLIQLRNVLGTIDTVVKIEYNESMAFFSFENIELVCRLIEGKYPNYEAVIPKENPNKLLIDRTIFMNSLKRVSIFSNQSTHQVRLKIAGNELTLSAEDIDYANSANERLTCQYDGNYMEIGFNSKFLYEMLTNIDTVTVSLEMSAPNRAGILIPADNENKEEDILMLVMPVMLNQ
ncbi:MAG: DNA polymerase III subunit beta [Bacteroidota bacterium]